MNRNPALQDKHNWTLAHHRRWWRRSELTSTRLHSRLFFGGYSHEFSRQAKRFDRRKRESRRQQEIWY